MIQNVLMTNLTPLRNTNEITCWQNRPFTTVWPEHVQQKTKSITRSIKKKPKRARTAFSTDQLRALEKTFSRHKYIDSEGRRELAKTLSIGEKCIKIWFQNRRMKEKKESSESGSDSASESYGTDTTKNVETSPESQTDHSSHYPNQVNNANGNDSYPYQLPTFHYHTNDFVPNMYEGVHSTNVSDFYHDNNVYPTQYYPNGNGYFGNEGNDHYYQYCNEVHNTWTPHNSYFFQVQNSNVN